MSRRRGVIAAWLACVLCAQAEPRLAWVPKDKDGRVAVEVTGLDQPALAHLRSLPAEALRETLIARVQQPSAPPMLGAWQVDGDVLRFTPQFSLTPGLAYRAEFDPARIPGGSGKPVVATYQMPAPPRGPATELTQVYPSGDEVPENLLKFYLHFSAPMSRGHIYDHIHLRDEAGKEVELPFLEIDEELWDPDMKRLTLFIDPGRIKREVKPLQDVGPALEAGHKFTLVIDAAWLDAAGHPLARNHQRTFRVTAPDRAPITPEKWTIKAPAAGTRNPLEVDFGEPLDHALASRLLEVKSANRKAVAGTPSLENQERTWKFTPEDPWSPGPHELVIPAILEDLAGNNVGKPFEVDLLERGQRAEYTRPARLSFEIK